MFVVKSSHCTKKGINMVFHKVEKVIALDNFMLKVKFENGIVKYYDVWKLITKDPQPTFEGEPVYERLCNEGMFPNVYVDYGGMIIAWDNISDISCDELWNNGTTTDEAWTEEDDQRCNAIPPDRHYTIPEPNIGNSEIGCFSDIVVQMFPCDNPEVIPQVVATYMGETAHIDINTGELIDGTFPPTGVELVNEWVDINRDDIQRMWDTGILKALPTL